MTDVTFRISGAVSSELTPEEVNATGIQVMHQGIGYDRVPVSNAPPDELGDQLNDETIAVGSFMQFMPQGWEQGKFYSKGSVVTDGIFSMVANVLTLANPFPQPDGTPTFTIPGFVPTTESDVGIVYSGHTWTLTENVLAKTINIWVTQLTLDTHYRVVIIKTPPGGSPVTTIIDDPVLTVAQFTTVAVMNQLLIAGTEITIFIDALNSGASNEVTGGWNYTGQDNVAAPITGNWNQNNARTLVRINKTDLDSTDRSAELLGIIVNSTLQFADTSNPNAFDTYRVTANPTDSGTFISYPVVLQEQGEGGVPIGTTTLTATVPISQATEYAQELLGLANPAWATVVPRLEFDGVDQVPVSTTAFGVDLEAEITVFSEDWDVLSFNG